MLGVAAVVVLVACWFGRGALLEGVGDLLVSEDAVEPSEWLVLSGASAGAASLEGVQLYRDRIAPRILVVAWRKSPIQERVESLGVPQFTPSELIERVLTNGGVPAATVSVVPGSVDGTESEIRAVADFARRQGVRSLLYVTSRTHTARARYLLGGRLGQHTRVLVRASRFDAFTSTDWWHDRDQTRDVLGEYLRWVNSFLLADLWRRPSALPNSTSSFGERALVVAPSS